MLKPPGSFRQTVGRRSFYASLREDASSSFRATAARNVFEYHQRRVVESRPGSPAKILESYGHPRVRHPPALSRSFLFFWKKWLFWLMLRVVVYQKLFFGLCFLIKLKIHIDSYGDSNLRIWSRVVTSMKALRIFEHPRPLAQQLQTISVRLANIINSSR